MFATTVLKTINISLIDARKNDANGISYLATGMPRSRRDPRIPFNLSLNPLFRRRFLRLEGLLMRKLSFH